MPGFRDAKVYPLDGPDFGTATALGQASGQVPATAELYTCLTDACSAQAEIIKSDLAVIGITVNVHEFPSSLMYEKLGTHGEPFDLATAGWVADYADPFDFVNVLLSGTTIRDTHNTNLAYFADRAFDSRMGDANLLVGAARSDAYARLDEDLTRDAAPWVAWGNDNNRDFSSRRGSAARRPSRPSGSTSRPSASADVSPQLPPPDGAARASFGGGGALAASPECAAASSSPSFCSSRPAAPSAAPRRRPRLTAAPDRLSPASTTRSG